MQWSRSRVMTDAGGATFSAELEPTSTCDFSRLVSVVTVCDRRLESQCPGTDGLQSGCINCLDLLTGYITRTAPSAGF